MRYDTEHKERTRKRVLREAASGFRISLVRETEHGEEVLDLDRLATDSEMSPIIKLVDTIIYNAMESRASDIHIETRDTEVQVKYRIDGALYAKVDPIDLAVLIELEYARERPDVDAPQQHVAHARGWTVRTVQRRRDRALAALRACRWDYLAAA